MSIYIVLSIIAVNIIALAVVYQFVKRLPQKERLVFIAVSIAIHYMLVSLVYWIASWGLGYEVSSDYIILVFVPINTLLTIPIFANAYHKVKEKKMKKNTFRNTIIIVGLIGILTLIFEYSYFKNYQIDMIQKVKEKQNNTISNVISNTVSNELTNEVTNVRTNTISNTVR